MSAEVDHLVVAAATLEQGAAWCEATLGVMPSAGGRHPLMGTHNRLLSIANGAFARAYLEIIAIDPQAPPLGRARWFDLDDPALQAAVARAPQFIHWVLRCDDIAGALATLHAQGLDAGRALGATRATPQGELRWQISVRDDGRRLVQGALPTLIQWGERHPCDALDASGVSLARLVLFQPDATPLSRALEALQVRGVQVESGAPALQAELRTPRGVVVLRGNC